MATVFRPDLLAGKTAFVTGGGSGIGAGIAKMLAAQGARVALLGRTRDKLDAVAAAIRDAKGQALAVPADVRDYAAVEAAMASAVASFGGLDILVNSAAGNFLAPAAGLSANGFRAVVDIDLCGTFNACRAAFAHLSKAARRHRQHHRDASQHPDAAPVPRRRGEGRHRENLTQDLALEWASVGVRVNAVAPGPIAGTEGMARLAPGSAEAAFLLTRSAEALRDHRRSLRSGALPRVARGCVRDGRHAPRRWRHVAARGRAVSGDVRRSLALRCAAVRGCRDGHRAFDADAENAAANAAQPVRTSTTQSKSANKRCTSCIHRGASSTRLTIPAATCAITSPAATREAREPMRTFGAGRSARSADDPSRTATAVMIAKRGCSARSRTKRWAPGAKSCAKPFADSDVGGNSVSPSAVTAPLAPTTSMPTSAGPRTHPTTRRSPERGASPPDAHHAVIVIDPRRKNVFTRCSPTLSARFIDASCATSSNKHQRRAEQGFADSMNPVASNAAPLRTMCPRGYARMLHTRRPTVSARDRPLVRRCEYSMRVSTRAARGRTSPLHRGQWLPQPAPEPLARTNAPQTTTARSYASTPHAKRANRCVDHGGAGI